MKNTKVYNIALAGLGNVGGSLLNLLEANKSFITNKTSIDWNVVGISARNRKKHERNIDFNKYKWFDNPLDLAKSNPDVIVELIGGSKGLAYDLVRGSLEKSISVVTANKALIANHGNELIQIASNNNCSLLYEGAVCGSIPIVNIVRESLVANKISRLYGIFNGSCNFILTQMTKKSLTFDEALQIAKQEGFLEADPTTDVDGTDSAHKLAILSSLTFSTKINFSNVKIRGITEVSQTDILIAKKYNYCLKLIGDAKKCCERDQISINKRVEVALIPTSHPLAMIDDNYNGVIVEADYCKDLMFYGQGAGGQQTASSVAADIIKSSHDLKTSVFRNSNKFSNYNLNDDDNFSWYMRFHVIDKLGILAKISLILSKHNISISDLKQFECKEEANHNSSTEKSDTSRASDDVESTKYVNLVLLTHITAEKNILASIKVIKQLPFVVSEIKYFRIFEKNL